jgi:ribokinase
MKQKTTLVVGSANMDLVVRVQAFPRPGETIFSDSFEMFPGGKGANQAVACARLGGQTVFIGKLGKDLFGERLIENMRLDGIRLEHLLVHSKKPTGIALIALNAEGQNQIMVVSGSNMALVPADLLRKRAVFKQSSVVLLQLETPLDTVTRAAELARKSGAAVILNPAPGRKLPSELLRLIDYLTPNEIETEILTGHAVRDDESAEVAAKELLSLGVENVIITLGARGALLVNRTTTMLYPGWKVTAIDTTAAGDAFNGALAFSLASGRGLEAALPFANAVAAIAVTRMGAQSSMPTLREVKKFLKGRQGTMGLRKRS